MKKNFAKLWIEVKGELTPTHKDFKYLLMWCSGLIICTFLALFWVWPIFVMIVLCIGAVITSKGGRVIYLLIFLFPLSGIFKVERGDLSFRIHIFVLVVIILGIKYAIQVLKKQKKIELWPTIFCSALVIVFCIPFTFNEIDKNASLVLGALFLYFMWGYRKDINLREIFIVLFLGILVSAALGLVPLVVDTRVTGVPGQVPIISGLDTWTGRYGGLYTNPLTLTYDTMLCMAILFALFLNGDMRYCFYPMFAVLFTCVLASGSKAGIVSLCIAVFFFLLFYILKSIKRKCSWKKMTRFLTIFLAICIILTGFNMSIVSQSLNRFIPTPPPAIVEPSLPLPDDQPPAIIEESPRNSIENLLDKITTFRYSIWKAYLKAIFDDFWGALFGHGVDAPNDVGAVIDLYPGYEHTPHSTIIAALYYVGFLGVAIILAWALTLLIPLIKQKKLNWFNIILLAVSFGIYLIAEDIFLYLLAIYIATLFPMITYQGKEIHNPSSVENPVKKAAKIEE